MYKKDLGRFILGALLVFLVVAVIGFLSVNSLKREALLVARDTLPGLINAGNANNLMEDNFLRSLSLADLKTAEERDTYLQQIELASKRTEFYMKEYEAAIFSDEDRANFQKLMETRKQYDAVRLQFFDLVRKGNQDAALAFFKASVMPAYDKYNTAGNNLFDYNVKVGKTRGEKILMLSCVTPIVVGLFGVAIFIVGALVGFRTTLP